MKFSASKFSQTRSFTARGARYQGRIKARRPRYTWRTHTDAPLAAVGVYPCCASISMQFTDVTEWNTHLAGKDERIDTHTNAPASKIVYIEVRTY